MKFKPLNQGIVLDRFYSIHGDKYDYSKVKYVNSKVPIIIGCKTHGYFKQTPQTHYKGGCPKCATEYVATLTRKTLSDLIKEFVKVHGTLYDYSLLDYKKCDEKVEILCKTHGSFWQTPIHHKTKGCPRCKLESVFIKKANKKHKNKYLYTNLKYEGMRNPAIFKCPIHGSFTQTPMYHLNGGGCGKCKKDIKNKELYEEFVTKIPKSHLINYDFSAFTETDAVTKKTILCKLHGPFTQLSKNFVKFVGCLGCRKYGPSKAETKVFDFIKTHTVVEQSNRKILKGKEIDIYIPSLKVGIEYHGLYWHSDAQKENRYHLNKLNLANSKGVQLVQVFQDEWENKEEIVKSRLLNIIGKTPNRIYGRKTEIKEVSTPEAMKFLQENHLQGKLGAKVKLGLYLKDELVSLMTFGGLRKNLGQTSKEGSYELLRFCNKLNTTVIGGASKLFKHFVKTYNPKHIISYADKRWSEGKLYDNLGFTLSHESKPNYFYTKGYVRENRFKYRKSELVKAGFDKNKTEKQIMEERGFNRIYDCGAKCYIKEFI